MWGHGEHLKIHNQDYKNRVKSCIYDTPYSKSNPLTPQEKEQTTSWTDLHACEVNQC